LGPWSGLPRGRHGPLEAALQNEALSFFANGQLVRTYQIGELVSDPDRLGRSWSHFTWLTDGHLDDDRMEYRLTTEDGNWFVFDVGTGAIVIHFRRRWWGVVGGIGVGAVALLVWRPWLRTKKRNTDHPQPIQ